MPAFLTELAPFEFDLTAYGQNYVRAYDPRWQVCLGIGLMDFMLDARNVVVVGSQAAIEVIPFIQFATTRTDRPGAPIEISGTPLDTDDTAHYQQALTTTWSRASEFYVRRGVAVRLNANGTFGRARGFLRGDLAEAMEVCKADMRPLRLILAHCGAGPDAVPFDEEDPEYSVNQLFDDIENRTTKDYLWENSSGVLEDLFGVDTCAASIQNYLDFLDMGSLTEDQKLMIKSTNAKSVRTAYV